MTRKRLGSIDPSRARDVRTSAKESALTKRKSALGSGPPIAQVAASVTEKIESEMSELRQENRALSQKAGALDAALSEGRVVVSLGLDQIDPKALSRDRRHLRKDGEEWAALKASIQTRGQQVPIEVTENGSGSDTQFDLVSGLRRWSVLEELFRETGEVRFSRVLAFVREMPETVPKMIAMIEENEIRHDISFFERGRICSVAASQGLFASVDEAVEALFENSNRNRRYKIRCFVTVYDEIGTLLDFPEHIGERLGISLAKALRQGRGGDLKAELEDRNTRFEQPADELGLLGDFASQKGVFGNAAKSAVVKDSKLPIEAEWNGSSGAQIKAKASKGKVTLSLKGLPDLDQSGLEELIKIFASKHR